MANDYDLVAPVEPSWALRSPVKFGAAMVGLIFLLKVMVLPLLNAIDGDGTTGPVLKRGYGMVCLAFVFIPVETLLGQTLPIWALRKFGVTAWPSLIALSAIFFGLIHAPGGLDDFFIGLFAGLVLSYCWLIWCEDSFGRAFWSTTCVHWVHNLLGFMMYMIAT